MNYYFIARERIKKPNGKLHNDFGLEVLNGIEKSNVFYAKKLDVSFCENLKNFLQNSSLKHIYSVTIEFM